MKKITLLIVSAFLVLSVVQAQEKEEFNTILGSVESYGAYGSFSLGYAQINSRDAFVGGGQAALILNHSLAVGVAGKGFINEYHYDDNLLDNVNLQGGYGGLLIEPILGAQQAVHFSFPIVIGAGGIIHADKIYDYHHDYYYEDYINDSDIFFVVEPGAEVEFNMFKFFRLSMGAFYRYTSNVDLYDTPDNVLHGFSFLATFKFGKF